MKANRAAWRVATMCRLPPAASMQECLERMILVGQASLRRATSEFIAHYHMERNHQGIENRLL